MQQAIEELTQNLPQRENVSLRVHQATTDVLAAATPLLADCGTRSSYRRRRKLGQVARVGNGRRASGHR